MWFFAKIRSIKLPLECKKLIILNTLFQGGRFFVGAICFLYFLSFNLVSKDYAWIKITQAIVFIGLDLPIGYFLSKLGEFKSLIVSIFFGILGSLGYLFFTNFFGFLVSEIFLALSLSTWPVALSAYSMQVLEKYPITGLTEKFFHLSDAISNIFIFVCGFFGGVFYIYNKRLPYGIFLSFYLLAILFIKFFLKDFGLEEKKDKAIVNIFNLKIKDVMLVFPLASIIFLTQFLMQPLFHYWQSFFSDVFGVESKNMSIIFVSYSFLTSSISFSYSKLTQITFLRTRRFVLLSALFSSIFYCFFAKVSNLYVSLFFFSLVFGIFNLVQVSSGVLIQHKLKQENRMIMIKFISFYSRIGMLLSLIILHCLFANLWKLKDIYQLYGFFSISVFALFLIWTIRQSKVKMIKIYE